jgi:creatinine amidohydrolase
MIETAKGCIVIFQLLFFANQAFSQSADGKGIFLADITWIKAKEILNPETVVVIPLGAQAKEHGPHMPMSVDFLQSQYLAMEVSKTEKVIIAPQMNYGFYFPFISFPGSTSLRHSVAKNMVVDICRSLAQFGPRRFYVLNEGVATNAALIPAAALLAREGILLTFTDLSGPRVRALVSRIQQQNEGTHADEIETSKILYMYPDQVNMKLAQKEYGIRKGKGFPVYDSMKSGHYIPSGIYGDATLATTEKGKKITEGMLKIIKEDIEELRTAALPDVTEHHFKPYIGTYVTDEKKTIVIKDDKGLICEFNNFPSERLHDEGDHYFSGFYYEAWFEANDEGEINLLRLTDVSGKVSVAKKVK